MKFSIKIIALFAICLISFFACVRPEDGLPPTSGISTVDKFKIGKYLNNGIEFKDSFTNYTFQFGSDLRLQAINDNGQVLTCDYRLDNGVLKISGFLQNPLTVINGNWNVTTLNVATIESNITFVPNVKELNWIKK
jgi:hypothetical protein